MERVIRLEGAAITLYDDRVSIEDGRKKNHKRLCILATSIWLLSACIHSWGYLNDGEHYKLFLIGISIFIFIINLLWLSDAREVLLEEVESVKFHVSAMRSEFLILKLKNSLRREVPKISPVADELEQYFAERGF